MEGWQKGAQAVIRMSSAGKENYFRSFPERKEWFQTNFPQHFGRSAAAATSSLKKVTKAKVKKQRLAAIRQAVEKRDQLKVSSDAVRAMGDRRRGGETGLGGGRYTDADLIAAAREAAQGGEYLKSGGLGSLFEEKDVWNPWQVREKDGQYCVGNDCYDTYEEAQKKADELNKEQSDRMWDAFKEMTKVNPYPKSGDDPRWGKNIGMDTDVVTGPPKDRRPADAKYSDGNDKRNPNNPFPPTQNTPRDEENNPIDTGKIEDEIKKYMKKIRECAMPYSTMQSMKSYKQENRSNETDEESGEYDYEGDMAKSQLRSIMHNSKMLHDMLEDTTNLPEWVQSKLTLAEDYIVTAANYMRGEMNRMDEEVEQIDEADGQVTTALQHLHQYEYSDALRALKGHPARAKIKELIDDANRHWDKMNAAENNEDRAKHEDAAHVPHDRAVAVLKSVRRKMKEEVEQINEGPNYLQYRGIIYPNIGDIPEGEENPDHGIEYTLTVPRDSDLHTHLGGDYSVDHPVGQKAYNRVARENPHLEPHHVMAIMNGTGDNMEDVPVTHGDKTYTHRIYNEQEPDYLYEQTENLEEAQKKLKPYRWRAEWRLGTESDVDKNNLKIFKKLAAQDPKKAEEFQKSLMKLKRKDMKEETDEDAIHRSMEKDLPFEPNAQRPEMPPGKHPAGYRYVRGLARQVMMANIDATQKAPLEGAEGHAELLDNHVQMHLGTEKVGTEKDKLPPHKTPEYNVPWNIIPPKPKSNNDPRSNFEPPRYLEEGSKSNDLVKRSMLPDKSVIPRGKGFGDDVKRGKIIKKTEKAIQKKRMARPTDNPSENEMIPQSMLPDVPGYPEGYKLEEQVIEQQIEAPAEETKHQLAVFASNFLTRTSNR